MHYLESLLGNIFVFFYSSTHSYGASILLFSVTISVLLTPFYHLTGILEKREKDIRDILQPYIDEINTIEDLQIRHSHLQVLYKSYNYLPIYSLRSLSSLFIQIPFFIAAYNMLKNFTGINDVSFLFFDNLGKADALLFGINVLPILMTIINIISVKLMTSFEQERKQSYIIAVFFLVLLYNSPAGIVLYWTLNNFINFIRYFIYWIRKNKFSLVFTNLKSMFKRLLNNENVTTFLLFISLYFSINLYSFGAYTRSNVGLLIILLIPFYLALLIKTGLFIKENISQIRSRNFIIKISILALLFIVSFAVYQYEKTHYLSAILVLLAVYNYKDIKIYRIKEFAKSSALSVIVILFPAILYIKSNLVYFAGNDIFTYLSLLILFSFLLPIAGYFLNKTSLNSISLFSISFVISAMFLPLIREVIGYSGETPLDFIVLFSIVLFIVSLFDKNKKIIIIFFLIAALCAATTDIKFTPMAQTDEISDETNTSVPQELLDLNMKEKDKASIYLFMHDSFPRKDLAQYLGLDYSGVEELFNEFGFTMYDVYSIGYYTRVTMTSLFDIQDHRVDEDLVNEIKGRRIMSGDNLVNFLLQAKGYTTAIAGEDNPYTYDKKLFAIGLTSGGGGIQNQVLLGIMQGHLNTMLLKHRKEGTAAMQAAEYANENAGKDKFFAWGAAGPDHSSLSLDLDMEFKKWSVKYVNAISEMRKELQIALKENPNAIIIIMSDHGPWMLGNVRQDYPNVGEADITPIYFRDKYGAFMAVRWPDKNRAAKYDKEFNITQDLFPIVLAYLYDSPIPLKYKIKNTAVRIKNHKFDKGIFYPNFYKENQK